MVARVDAEAEAAVVAAGAEDAAKKHWAVLARKQLALVGRLVDWFLIGWTGH